LRSLLESGVDCFKTDFGERIPTDAVYFDRSDPQLMHNYYSYLYNKSVFDVVSEVKGESEAMVFARSATAGGQKYPVHWGGDCFATWESMAENLRGGLCFGLSGGGFWSHDIGGFAGKADPNLFKRWIAFGMLSSHSRLHGSESYRVPWNYDDQSVDILRHFSRLKNRLFPYLYGAAHEASSNGTPVMRAMMLEFPHDPNCLHLDRQYMLGSSLLVAPIFNPDGVVQFYVPEGTWIDLLTHETYAGGRWHERECDPMQIPVLMRPGSVLPMSNEQHWPRWTVDAPVTLHVPAFDAQGKFTTILGQSASSDAVRLTVERSHDAIVLHTDRPLAAAAIRLHAHGAIKVIEGGEMVDASTVRWTTPQNTLVIRVVDITPAHRSPHV
jgi:alpha-D-xyloside xylohydrolase